MNNVRGLYPPLYGAPANGGGGGGGSIQVDTLPEASLEYKDKIVQYTGATTEPLTNGYFYKCIEHTETEGETITVTYSWDNIDVMEVESGGGFTIPFSTTPTEVGTYTDGKKVYMQTFTVTTQASGAILKTDANITRVLCGFGTIKPAFGGDSDTIGNYKDGSHWSTVVLGDNGVVKLLAGNSLIGLSADVTVMYVSN